MHWINDLFFKIWRQKIQVSLTIYCLLSVYGMKLYLSGSFYLTFLSLSVYGKLKFKGSERLSCRWNEDCLETKLCKSLIDSHCLCLHGQCEVIDDIPAETETCDEYTDCRCRWTRHLKSRVRSTIWAWASVTVKPFQFTSCTNKALLAQIQITDNPGSTVIMSHQF